MERTEALRGELSDARTQTDMLFDLISPEALYSRPVEERHRLIFYLGHFDAFDWNLLARRGMSETSFHPEFDKLFERGIDPAPGEKPGDSAADWPRRNEVTQYRLRIREWVDEHLDELDPWLLQMAIEHRQMHAETFAYLMHNLPYDQKRGQADVAPGTGTAAGNLFVQVPEGIAILGKRADRFGWDNEHLAHRVFVPAFAMTRYKISNGQYLEFVKQGGSVPHFWTEENGYWFYRGMFQRMPLPLDFPVWVTWRQADAYTKWRGASLPSEAQFQLAASRSERDAARDNFGFHRWDPVSVASEAADTQRPAQMVGNGWEWTRDVFTSFEGFEPHPFYPGYSADFFDGEHYVLKGASPRTAALLTRPSFRNWFRPDYPHVYAGFRLVES